MPSHSTAFITPKDALRFALLSLVPCLCAVAQDPVKAYPKNYNIAFQNKAVDVIRVHYGPHEKVGVHDHSAFPTVYVYLSDSGPVRFQHSEAKPFAITRPPTFTGAYRVSPGRVERHTVENLGDQSSDFLRVELKQLPLGTVREFRGEAPKGPLASEEVMEYSSPALRIERVVCAGEAPCSLQPSPAPSLLVGFSAFRDSQGSSNDVALLPSGAVRWLAALQAAQVASAGGSPAQLLRIYLPGSSQ